MVAPGEKRNVLEVHHLGRKPAAERDLRDVETEGAGRARQRAEVGVHRPLQRALQAVDYHPAFGFNYDPSHFGYQGVDYVKFLYKFSDRIFHVHMKDVAWGIGDGTAGVFGGHVDFHKPSRYWDFKSVGRGNINFERIIRALNDIDYGGPLSVEWEDGAMDREFGAAESAAFVKKIDFPPSKIIFDAQFAENSK